MTTGYNFSHDEGYTAEWYAEKCTCGHACCQSCSPHECSDPDCIAEAAGCHLQCDVCDAEAQQEWAEMNSDYMRAIGF